MGWTPTPGKPTCKPKYKLERGKFKQFIWTEELKAEFCRLFPRNCNRKMMELFGISFSCLQRLKREWGLQHDMKVIKHKQAMDIKRKCEKNGYYDSIRGKKLSEAALEAARKKRAEGFHPMKQLKENNPRRYAAICKRRSKRRIESMNNEKRLRNYGLQELNYHLPQFKYTKRQSSARYYAKQHGYIPGKPWENSGERYIIFYTDSTQRSKRYEDGLEQAKLTLKYRANE